MVLDPNGEYDVVFGSGSAVVDVVLDPNVENDVGFGSSVADTGLEPNGA